MVSQIARPFGTTNEAKAIAKNLINKNKGFINRASEVEKAAKMALAEDEALKKSQAEELVKLASTLAKIESLKEEVHLLQRKVASPTKQVEMSNAHKSLLLRPLRWLIKKILL